MLFYEYENCKDEVISKLWDSINNSNPEDWHRENNTVEWRINITQDVFDHTPKTQALIKEFVQPHRIIIQRLEPRTSYNWHIDYARNASLTMCLNQTDRSLTLFAERRETHHFCELRPLYYKPNTMYLFNGAKWHCGINYSDETRYLISISLTKPTDIHNAIHFLKQNFSI